MVGGIKTSMASKPGNHIEVTFALNDQGVEAPVVTKVAPKLHQEVFAGNKRPRPATSWRPPPA